MGYFKAKVYILFGYMGPLVLACGWLKAFTWLVAYAPPSADEELQDLLSSVWNGGMDPPIVVPI